MGFYEYLIGPNGFSNSALFCVTGILCVFFGSLTGPLEQKKKLFPNYKKSQNHLNSTVSTM